ncbi:hypothetical protein [Candidatus Solirubrobacter pratensis]|uniref:hypothetical protein n=1 Tax=Candidatus Solirubrobacter pratensis TaxID=1298857 RepID=UPI0018CB4D70|nr:hypothetical protein [Candidatus Solirubrobacter pratensis]
MNGTAEILWHRAGPATALHNLVSAAADEQRARQRGVRPSDVIVPDVTSVLLLRSSVTLARRGVAEMAAREGLIRRSGA